MPGKKKQKKRSKKVRNRELNIGLASRISRKVFAKLPRARKIKQNLFSQIIDKAGFLPRFGFWVLGRISMQEVSLKDVITKIFTPY